MSPRAWIGRGAAAAAASAALIMAFQPAATAAPHWTSPRADQAVQNAVTYSEYWNQGNHERSSRWARWAPSADDGSSGRVRPASETAPARETDVAEATTSAPATAGNTAAKIFELTNAERAKAGLPALRHNDCLASTAQSWSNQMASEGRMYHSNLRTWMGKCSLSSAGENVAYGGRSAEETVRMWMNSPGHRANILSAEYTDLGVGWVDGSGYATQAFGA